MYQNNTNILLAMNSVIKNKFTQMDEKYPPMTKLNLENMCTSMKGTNTQWKTIVLETLVILSSKLRLNVKLDEPKSWLSAVWVKSLYSFQVGGHLKYFKKDMSLTAYNF